MSMIAHRQACFTSLLLALRHVSRVDRDTAPRHDRALVRRALKRIIVGTDKRFDTADLCVHARFNITAARHAKHDQSNSPSSTVARSATAVRGHASRNAHGSSSRSGSARPSADCAANATRRSEAGLHSSRSQWLPTSSSSCPVDRSNRLNDSRLPNGNVGNALNS